MLKSVIGLEIHAQLLTKSKMFCSCSASYGAPPNTNVCPVCLGYPGALPSLNKEAVKKAVTVALALNCKINTISSFDRKNYFYPDLPKGYQITQFYKPFAENGFLHIDLNGNSKKIRIERIHLEEDAGKSIHDTKNKRSLIDINRSGIPLIEIVTKPDIETPEQAAEFLKKLRQTLMYIEVNDGNLEEGSLRCDANVSVHEENKPLGTRVEIKNVNSFKFIQNALKYEIERHVNIIKKGNFIKYETRLYDSSKNKTYTMRTKEQLLDYRYFPEPDLLNLHIDKKMINTTKESMPELPDEKKKRFIKDYKIKDYDAGILTTSKSLASFYENTVKYNNLPGENAKWIISELLRYIKDIDTDFLSPPISAEQFSKFVKKVASGELTALVAKDLLPEIIKTGKSIEKLIKEKGVKKIDSDEEISKIIKNILKKNDNLVEKYRNGKTKLFGFFMGQVMKATKGNANPKKVKKILKDILDGG